MGFSEEEWKALPWWLSRTYLDGLEEEGLMGTGDSGTGAQPLPEVATGPLPDGLDNLAGRGFNVRKVAVG